jgi:hypothetical protein
MDRGVRGIILHTTERVWVDGCYSDLIGKPIIQVGDGTSNGFDETGNCILSIPANTCNYWTTEEAQNIEECIEADALLLSYAF